MDGRASTAREGDLGTKGRFVACEDVAKMLVPLKPDRTTHSNVARDPLCPV